MKEGIPAALCTSSLREFKDTPLIWAPFPACLVPSLAKVVAAVGALEVEATEVEEDADVESASLLCGLTLLLRLTVRALVTEVPPRLFTFPSAPLLVWTLQDMSTFLAPEQFLPDRGFGLPRAEAPALRLNLSLFFTLKRSFAFAPMEEVEAPAEKPEGSNVA